MTTNNMSTSTVNDFESFSESLIIGFEDEYRRIERAVWMLAVAAAMLDVITTIVALQNTPLVETVPLAIWTIETFGLAALFPKKMFVLALMGGVWAVFPRPIRLTVPSMAVAVWLPIALNNARLLVQYHTVLF